jgi:hypothetical protein
LIHPSAFILSLVRALKNIKDEDRGGEACDSSFYPSAFRLYPLVRVSTL